MVYLKKAWHLWSDIVTFGWLERLRGKHPRLAGVITGILVSIGFGLAAWYYLDRRFVIFEKQDYVPVSWITRLIYGVLFSLVSLIAAYFTIVVAWKLEISFSFGKFGLIMKEESEARPKKRP